MARLPTVGGDDGNWGTILNNFLQVGHNSDGTLKNLFYNVADYGAVADGVTDDTGAIQAAIDAASSTGGEVLLLPRTSIIKSSLIISSSDVSIQGHGQETSTLNYTGSGSAITIAAGTSTLTSIHLKNFGITCVYTGTTKGINVTGSGGGVSYSVWENIKIQDCGNSGIVNADGSTFTRITIKNCKITHCGDFGVAGFDQVECVLDSNYFSGFASANYASHAIYLKRNAKYNIIVNNTMVDVSGENSSAIEIWGDTSIATNNLVSNNIIRNSLQGIEIVSTSQTSINNNFITSDNSSGTNGVHVYFANAFILLTNNTVSNMTANGLKIQGAPDNLISEITIISNICTNNKAGDFLSYATKLLYKGNFVDPKDTTASGHNGVTISNVTTVNVVANFIHAAQRALTIQNATDADIRDNTFFNNASGDCDYGVRLIATITRSSVIANNFSTMGSAPPGGYLTNAAISSIIKNNVGVADV